ncbi:hypothetical protein H9P43_003392 [Blastocladiella emersonii ATCC 22665]|nr:hypothetical protein H9P43_003392 [Blastocladiella emersonii ATCC 22665]
MTVARYIQIDPATLSLYQRLTAWVVHPQSRRYVWWRTLVLISIYITVVVEPYASAFDRRESLISWLYAADLLYFFDVVLRFHLPYIEEHVYIMDVRKITWNYVETEFWLDLAALVPIEVVAPMFSSDIAFWIRVYRCFKFFSEQQADLNASVLLIFLKFSFLISLVCHWYTCIIFIVGCPAECSPGDDLSMSWPSTALPYLDMREEGRVSKYLISLYFSVYTLTTTGYGHLHPVSDPERWVIIFGIGLCNFVFGYCTGTVTSLLVNYRGTQLQYEQKVQAVRDYMMQRSFPEDLQSRILDYYEYMWLRTAGIDAYLLLQHLPPAFNAEVTLRMNETLLAKVPIFSGASKSFLMTLSRALRPEVFLPGDLIVHKGDVGQEMYFICRGKVEVVSDDLLEVYDAMGEGTFFGEVSLLLSCPRTDNIRAATHCDIRVLSKPDLDQILEHFPDMAERIYAKAQERVRKHTMRASINSLTPMTDIHVSASRFAAAGASRSSVAIPHGGGAADFMRAAAASTPGLQHHYHHHAGLGINTSTGMMPMNPGAAKLSGSDPVHPGGAGAMSMSGPLTPVQHPANAVAATAYVGGGNIHTDHLTSAAGMPTTTSHGTGGGNIGLPGQHPPAMPSAPQAASTESQSSVPGAALMMGLLRGRTNAVSETVGRRPTVHGSATQTSVASYHGTQASLADPSGNGNGHGSGGGMGVAAADDGLRRTSYSAYNSTATVATSATVPSALAGIAQGANLSGLPQDPALPAPRRARRASEQGANLIYGRPSTRGGPDPFGPARFF